MLRGKSVIGTRQKLTGGRMSSLSLASTPRKLGKNRITRIIFKEKKCIQDLNNVFKFIRV
jgi:hypothetical protein